MDKEGSSRSPRNGVESRNSVLDYINEVLMEEDIEGKPCMFYDAVALQAMEKSLYEVLGEEYPTAEKSLDNSGNSNAPSQSTPKSGLPSTLRCQNGSSDDRGGNGVLGSLISDLLGPNCFLQNEWVLQFNKGVEEANKFLPKFNLENIASAYEPKREFTPSMARKRGEDEGLEEARNNKQSAVSVDENELSDWFDKMVFSPPACPRQRALQERARRMSEQKEQANGSCGGKVCTKKKGDDKKIVDLRALLIFCAQAVSSNDFKTANEHLQQIRRHSSPFGDGYQRLAHVFADALEARIAGTGTQIYTALSSKERSAADVLKAYLLYIAAFPFERGAVSFANRSIMKITREKKATTLHVIDFGIFYGFQWPTLIMRLLEIHGGPIKLRITGIDIPMPGFRPLEAVQETGRHLARYCEKFNVQFEYNGIAQKWDTIQVEDLNLKPDEVIVVNCLYRLHNLLDDSVVENNPRDAVLNLIRKINPDMFIHSVVNGSYLCPFFLTRFKEALYHTSSLFDMFDSRIPRADEVRLMFEQERLKREVMNVVACEGTARIERPESYKQWQARTTRAGFKQRSLDHNLLNKLRGWIKSQFQHPDEFSIETHGEWMLQGWKGKLLFASSIWEPEISSF